MLVRLLAPSESADACRLPIREEIEALKLDLDAAHYLGRLGDMDCFALAYEPARKAATLPLLPAFSFRSLRKLYGPLDEELWALAGRAWQIVNWDDTHRFCGRCATPLIREREERAKRCPQAGCGLSAFPRVSPAVIVLVRKGAQALLAHAARFPPGVFSTLAGFVEAGESLEDTVKREIREEAGIEVKNLRYFGSQSWPFPHSLMVGFLAEYAGGEPRPDGKEILEVRFFDVDALPLLPPPLSIARRLINSWIAEQDPLRHAAS